MRTALVTGANRGIGLAITKGLAEAGLQVLLASRNIKAGEDEAALIQGDVKAVELDLSSRELVARHMEAILRSFPQIDILVNNAGVLEQGRFLDIGEQAFDHSMQVNFYAPFHLMRILVPGMIARGYGRVVNLSSGWGAFSEGLSGPTAYSVSKAALDALTLSLSHDLPKNVKVNSMCPGWVRTRMGGEEAPRTPEEGADTAIWLATLPDDGPNGAFFRNRKPIDW